MKILFSGGGTLGPVTPLLAIFEYLKEDKEKKFIWVGTERGPEESLIREIGIPFFSLPSSKFRRYFSWQTFFDIFVFIDAFFKSLLLLRKERPDVCISAGGYVSVPLHYAAWVLGIPTWIHQQDVIRGLANRLMGPIATRITVALEMSKKKFFEDKTIFLGNPIRPNILSGKKAEGIELFGLDPNLPTIFATGGGTGSEKINMLIAQVAFELDGICQIIHLTGVERKTHKPDVVLKHYHCFEFLTQNMKAAYAVADIVVSRGGFGTLSELAALKKASIIIPKPGHQEQNVGWCRDGGGVIALDEDTLSSVLLADVIRGLIKDTDQRKLLGENLNNLIPQATKDDIISCLNSLQKTK